MNDFLFKYVPLRFLDALLMSKKRRLMWKVQSTLNNLRNEAIIFYIVEFENCEKDFNECG